MKVESWVIGFSYFLFILNTTDESKNEIFLAVESRHCRELGKILSNNLDRWNELRGALGIPILDVKNVYDQIKQNDGSVPADTAFYSLIYHWISKSPKHATFGHLLDILAWQLEFMESASEFHNKLYTMAITISSMY